MNGEDILSLGLVAGIVALPFAVTNLVPGDEIGLIAMLGIGAIVLINQTGGNLSVGPVDLSA